MDVSPLSQTAKNQNINPPVQLLVLSNGHGEDVIAARIVQALQSSPHSPEIFALPIVGKGHKYQELNIPVIGAVRTMPSGGFIYMDGNQLMGDIRGGLLQLTWNQIKAIRHWVNTRKKSHTQCAILAVGDIVPLLLAWVSGANYTFVGTAKSEYYVRDEAGLLKRHTKGARWENFSGSIYHPWERWLMSHRRCQGVFPRDSLTTKILQKWSIPAFDLGNPMMDGLEPTFPSQSFFRVNAEQEELTRPLVVTLLPGSRPPEAYNNWETIAIAVSSIMANLRQQEFRQVHSRHALFLAAISPNLDMDNLCHILQCSGWRFQEQGELPIQINDNQALTFKQNNAYLILTQNAYNDCLYLADVAIAMAGTATEQFVGLGKPAITIPGEGPQFTPAFAEAQSRHLGRSVILVPRPEKVGEFVRSLFNNPDEVHLICQNGMQRMGQPGAAQRIADCLIQRLSNPS
ncbi:lipid-A-disaccharide synthase-related protein [Calothrix rhizosoleniae]|uniref:lipid-A-disaccharide synthase-related protein n=1 Tax=Calothrix rhizosoleniae TaxID=888997 RepID=UPI000B49B249|nr:lipid-A-disaccharide synthase-related protein [Calothrix rhizosoleniae]